MSDKVTVDMTTGVGTLSFPKVHPATAADKKDANGNPTGEKSYEIQILIPKTDKKAVKEIMEAIKTVGEAAYGSNYKRVRHPLRDGDKEAKDLAADGKQTKGDKYPERKGHFFLNARSKRPVGVYGRDLAPIHDHDALYGGCKGRISISIYPYASNGNTGIGAGLNGVQKVGDGEPFGGGAPSVESMFDLMEGEGDSVDIDMWESEMDGGKKSKKGKKSKPAPEPPAKKGKSKKGKKGEAYDDL